MTLEEIRNALQDRRLHIVAEATGLHVNTLRNIRDGVTKDPSYSVVLALKSYFGAKEHEAAN